MDTDKVIEDAVKDGIRKGIQCNMNSSYNNPFQKSIEETIAKHDKAFRDILSEALNSAIGDDPFREEIRMAVRKQLAKTLIARFGGELEKQVNTLKSDPTTRARITLAIDEILKERVTV